MADAVGKFGSKHADVLGRVAGQAAAARVAAPPPAVEAARPTPPPSRQQRGIGRARALYDYDSAEADDLQLREGEEITIIAHVDEGWSRGENSDGRSGIFPRSYVEEL